MPIGYTISEEELFINRKTGFLSGDDAPGSTQDGVVTKFGKMSNNIFDDYDHASTGIKQVFDAHDHTTGGQPLGTGGVRSFADNAITTAKILNANVTGAKIASSAVTTAKIQNAVMTTSQIGDAESDTIEIPGGGTANWTAPSGVPFFHLEGRGSSFVQIQFGGSISQVVFTNLNSFSVSMSVVYRGGA